MRHAILILFFSVFINGTAQQANNYTFRHLDQTDGLLHNSVLSIGQDEKGYMWILTANGLQRYDGNRFINYPGIVNNPSSIFSNGAELYVDKEKNVVWVSKQPMIQKLDLLTNRLVVYDADDLLKKRSEFDTYTNEKNNPVLLGSKGIFTYDDSAKKFLSTFVNIYPSSVKNSVTMATDDADNQMWVAGWNQLLLFDSKLKKVYSMDYNPIGHPLLRQLKNLGNSSFRIILLDTRHDLWLGSWGEYLYRYEKGTKKLSVYSLADIKKKQPDKQNTDAILVSSALFEDNHQNLWIGTENAGLLKYDKQKNDFDFIISDKNNSQTLQYNYRIFCIFQDKEENIWLGTDKGISIFNPYRQYLQAIHFDENSTVPVPKNEIDCFIQTITGDILVGTWGGGITVFDSDWHFKKNIVLPGTYESNLLWCFLQNDDGNIWAGCQHGYIHIYNPITGVIQTIHPPEMNNFTIRCAAKDKKGNMWMGLNNGKIVKWDRAENKFYPYNDSTKNNLPLAPVQYIFIDEQQRCWVSTEKGFKQFDLEKRSYTTTWLPDKNDPQAILGITSKGIEQLDDSTILVGTIYGGLNIFNTNKKTFSHLTVSHGFPSNNVYALKKDTAGYIWFTTDYDIYKFKPADKKYIRYNIQPGTMNSAFKLPEFYALQDGRWLTTSETEIISFHSQKNTFYGSNKSRVEITGFKVFDSTLFIDSILASKQAVQLTYRQNFLTIEFAVLNFSNMQHNKYYYRLSNVDHDWVMSDTKNFASYTNLSPGEYVFSVKTENDQDESAVTSFKIIVAPPFWQTAWFRLMIVFCVVLLVYLFVKWRERNIKLIETGKLKVQQLNAQQYKNKLELEQIINFFSSSLIDKNTVEDVLWDVAKNLIGRLGFVDCMIYLWNEDKTRMIQKAGFGPKGSIEEINKRPFDVLPAQGVVGHVIAHKEAVLIPDTTTDSRYRADEMERLSEIAVPLLYNNELIGVIDSEHPEKNYYTPEHLHILNTIATLMANKIKSIEAEQMLQRTQIEMYSMNEQLSKARLEALRAQMNPHFIFNCLNSIDNLIQMDEKEKATLYLSKFARLIRSILENAANNVVSCWKDIETLQIYLELESLRFDNKFSYQLNIGDEILNGDYKVPPLIVQPFVENAIHHGLLNKIKGDKKLVIKVSAINNHIHYLIEDNGVGRIKAAAYKQLNKPAYQSMGLQITKDRINLFNQGKNGSVKITDLVNEQEEACGTKVEVELINQS